MSLLNPAALLLLLIALPVTLLYVLRVRLRRAPVSSMMFWQKALADQPPRAFWQRFRHLTSWLVTMLLLALLTLAAADIRWSGRSTLPQRLVLVLDVSSGMAAAEDGTSRLDRARQAALRLLTELSDDDEAAVIAAGTVPVILCGVTSHQPTLRRAITNARQTPGPGDLEKAVELAQRLAASAGPAAGAATGRLVVFSDGCGKWQPSERVETGPPNEQPREVPVEWKFFGKPQPNAGFTAFQVRRSEADPLGYEVFVRVRNAADFPLTARVELERDGIPLDVIPVSLAPNEEWTHVISKLSADGGRLHASLTELRFKAAAGAAGLADGLAADNTAWAVLPARPRQNVLLVSPGSLFVQKVLEANPLIDLTVWRELPENPVWPEDTLVVLHELVPAVLPPGPVLVLDPRGSCDAWKIAGEVTDPVLESAQGTAELMRNVRLEQVLIPAAAVLEFTSPPQVLATAVGGVPLYSLVRRSSGGAVLVLAIRLGGSDLAYRTVFPILVANALNQFGGRGHAAPAALAAGDTARLILSAAAGTTAASDGQVSTGGVQTFRLRSPSDALQQLAAAPAGMFPGAAGVTEQEWLLVTEPLLEAGIWEVSAAPAAAAAAATPVRARDGQDGEPLLEFAVNAAIETEVDLRPAASLPAAAETAVAGTRWLPFGSVTGWLLLLTLLLLAVDWALHQRRWLA